MKSKRFTRSEIREVKPGERILANLERERPSRSPDDSAASDAMIKRQKAEDN